MGWVPLVLVVLLAMGFNYTNGFHDAANAIATSVSTRALTPRIALLLAAVFNLVGAFFGAKVAKTIGSGIIGTPGGNAGLTIVAAALIGAIGWNLLTWWRGLPSSSSHALIGGLAGAALAAGATVHWDTLWSKVIIWMIISPIAGLILGYLVMSLLLWVFRRSNPGRVSRGFRYAQSFSACAMAFGHGLQDAAKTAGVVVLALNIGGYHSGSSIPIWVLVLSAIVISLGTYSGGWRIMRTLGRRIIHLDPPHGFAAETTAASVPVRRRAGVRRAGLDHAHDHRRDHGGRCDQADVRRAVGRRGQHRRGLGPDLPRSRPHRRPRLRRPAPPLTPPPFRGSWPSNPGLAVEPGLKPRTAGPSIRVRRPKDPKTAGGVNR